MQQLVMDMNNAINEEDQGETLQLWVLGIDHSR